MPKRSDASSQHAWSHSSLYPKGWLCLWRLNFIFFLVVVYLFFMICACCLTMTVISPCQWSMGLLSLHMKLFIFFTFYIFPQYTVHQNEILAFQIAQTILITKTAIISSVPEELQLWCVTGKKFTVFQNSLNAIYTINFKEKGFNMSTRMPSSLYYFMFEQLIK